MGLMRAFTRTSITVDRRAVPAYAITCNGCGKQEKIISSKPSGNLPVDLIAKKFGERGWNVGSRVREDRCPECVEQLKLSRKKEPAPVVRMPEMPKSLPLMPVVLASVAAVSSTPPKADTPPAMEKEDRRIIFSEIDSHYLDETKGYSDGWTDARIATGLNVPLAWVREIREANFGPEIGTSVTEDLKKMQAAIEKGGKIVKRMDDFAEQFEKSLSSFRKAYEVIKKEADDTKAAVNELSKRIIELNKRIS